MGTNDITRLPPLFAHNYEEYVADRLMPVRSLVQEILEETWREDDYWAGYRAAGTAVPRPVQRVAIRIKRAVSVLDKFERHRDVFPDGPIAANFPSMHDFLGARVVTFFVSHLKMMDQEIRSGRHFRLSESHRPKAYISRTTLERLGMDPKTFELTEPKWNGYASLHYFLSVKGGKKATREFIFELQVRTLVEDAWAEIHHQLGYKPEQQTHFSVERQFRVIASHLTAIDDHFDFLYDRLTYLQSQSDPRPEYIINAENFPHVMDTYNIPIGQGELDTVLKILGIHGVETVRQFQSLARPEIVEAIVGEYRLRSDVRVSARHLVATLVYLRPRSTAEEARAVVRYNVELGEVMRRTEAQAEDDDDGGAAR